jgi:hypothetical protein
MNAFEWAKAAVLGALLAVVVICVAAWILSRLGLLDHDGWVHREKHTRRRLHPRGRQMPRDFTVAERAALYERQRRTEQWFNLDDAVLAADWKSWENMPLVPHPTEPPLSANDHEEV